jgi:hypothetical protein
MLKMLSRLPALGWFWIGLGLVLGLALLAGAMLLGPWFLAGSGTSLPEPQMTIIPYPTLTTMAVLPTPTLPQASPSPQAEGTPSGRFLVGELVEVRGTEGDALRLRSEPGLQARILFLGEEHEVFEVVDGPQDADGYEWWLIRDPYQTSKQGWAVGRFLGSLESP